MDCPPSFEALKKMFDMAAEEGGTTVMSYDKLRTLVRMFLDLVEVDEEWYKTAYPDVAQAISAGIIRSAKEHFVQHGYFEDRLPCRVAVETRVTPRQLQEMITRVERNFRHMGEIEPHWSVLTDAKFSSKNIQHTRDEFYASGEELVNEFLETAERFGLAPNKDGTCFELGCGVGRSTIWLARHFRTVIGADVSAPHLNLARQAAKDFARSNISFVRVNRLDEIEGLPQSDAFFSIIVLQHNPPPLIRHLLGVILGKLRSGGLAYFQVPTYGRSYGFRIENYLSAEVRLGVPEMHVLPRSELLAVAGEKGCRVLDMSEDGAAGPSFVSNRVLLRKE